MQGEERRGEEREREGPSFSSFLRNMGLLIVIVTVMVIVFGGGSGGAAAASFLPSLHGRIFFLLFLCVKRLCESIRSVFSSSSSF